MEKSIGKLNDNVNNQRDHALQSEHSFGGLSLKDISKMNADQSKNNPGMDEFPGINQLLGDAGPKGATNQCVGEGGAKPPNQYVGDGGKKPNADGEQNKNVTKFNPGLAPWKYEPHNDRQ